MPLMGENVTWRRELQRYMYGETFDHFRIAMNSMGTQAW